MRPFVTFLARGLLLILCAAITNVIPMGCGPQARAPARPKLVPMDAAWAGGADGGAFFRCVFDFSSGLDACAVYNDYTGTEDVQGLFRIKGRSKAKDARRFAYSGFDGRKIYLKDGSILEPIPGSGTGVDAVPEQ